MGWNRTGSGSVAVVTQPVVVVRSGMSVPLTPISQQSPSNTTIFSGIALGRGNATPFAFSAAVTPVSFAINVTTAAAGSFLRLGMFADNGSGKPGALINDYGQVDTSTTGVKTWTNAVAFAGNTRFYFLLVCQGAGVTTLQINTQNASTNTDIGDPSTIAALANVREGWDIAGVVGAMPADISALATSGGVNSHPRIVAVFP